ncbi:hypothetical protein P3T73_11840 [Kiritimatiellota bacterium B12222]|nr:hypothetical protein P3T73_11840 [Kiritimatiellota bacterium B12222]
MYDPKTSIHLIIPVYRDQEALLHLLPHLLSLGWSPLQITVVDASEQAPFPMDNEWGIQVIHAFPDACGRAKQMNLGARRCDALGFLFLHADTYLPAEAHLLMTSAFRQGYVGGGFSRRFDSGSLFLKVSCFLADLRGKYFGWYFGDQAIFCSREAFEQLGGFPEISPFEDLEFCRKLKRYGRLTLLKPGVVSSARRFKSQGVWLRTWKDVGLTLRYFFHNLQLKSN